MYFRKLDILCFAIASFSALGIALPSADRNTTIIGHHHGSSVLRGEIAEAPVESFLDIEKRAKGGSKKKVQNPPSSPPRSQAKKPKEKGKQPENVENDPPKKDSKDDKPGLSTGRKGPTDRSKPQPKKETKEEKRRRGGTSS